MTEIRICRAPHVAAITDGGWPEGYLWAQDTPQRRDELEILMKVGNQLYGDGTHWIEEREAG